MAATTVAIITDETVNKLYGAAVEKELQAAGFETSLIAVAAGEQSKSLETAQLLYDFSGTAIDSK